MRITVAEANNQQFDLELTDQQWARYANARQEGRLVMVTDVPRQLFVMSEQVKPEHYDKSQLKEGAEIVDQGKVIAMGKMTPAQD